MTAAGLDSRPAGARAVEGLSRGVVRWAQRRSLSPNSVTGLSLTLGVCAAAWFSAGTAVGNLAGGLALCASYLVLCTARWLAAGKVPEREGQLAKAPAAAGPARASAARLVVLSGTVSSAACYAGLAVGGSSAGLPAMWQLAMTALIMTAVRDLAWVCRGEDAADPGGDRPVRGRSPGRPVWALLSFPFGGRVALIAVTAPTLGARVTLLALVGWATVAVGTAIASPVRRSALSQVLGDPAGCAAPGDDVAAAPGDEVAAAADDLGAVVDDVAVGPGDDVPAAAAPVSKALPLYGAAPRAGVVPAASLSPAETAAGEEAQATAPGETAPAESPSGVMAPGTVVSAAEETATLQELLEAGSDDVVPVSAPDPRLLATAVACRDDGRLAQRLGRAVRGQLVPLPPALAGLAATALLGWLGMRNLPGLLLLTPLVVMLLAAFGSAHPHDRGLDWLTPSVLLAGQLLYTAAVGVSFRVPVPLTFTLCALIALHCASLASGAGGASLASGAGGVDRSGGQRTGAGLGWEGRMLIVGLGAMAGVPAVAFAGLAVYLAVSTGARVLPRYVALPRS